MVETSFQNSSFFILLLRNLFSIFEYKAFWASLSSLSSIETNALGGDITSTCKDEKSKEIAKLNYIPFNSGLW